MFTTVYRLNKKKDQYGEPLFVYKVSVDGLDNKVLVTRVKVKKQEISDQNVCLDDFYELITETYSDDICPNWNCDILRRGLFSL